MSRKAKFTKAKRKNFLPTSCSLVKKSYKTEDEAKKTAEIQMLVNQGLELKVYKCDLCNYWHLTSVKNSQN